MQTQTPTFEAIKEIAIANLWSNRQIKDALFDAGLNERRAELVAAVQALRPAPVVVEKPAPIVEVPVVPAPQVIAEAPAQPLKLEEGAVIWCDAAENKVRRVVNGYGRLATFDNGGYRVGLVSGGLVERHYNSVCPDQFAAECFAVLKAVELAVRHGLKTATIRNDRIGGFEVGSGKSRNKGFTYLWVAQKLARENGLSVAFELCSGDENKADHASRTEAR